MTEAQTKPAQTVLTGQESYLLASIVENSEDPIISKDLSGVVISWNRAAERIYGYAAAEMIGQSILKIIPRELHEQEETILERLRRGERLANFETVRLRKDGTPVDVSLTISPIRDGEGRIIGISKIARDITQRKRIEAAIAESERFNRGLIESSRDCMKIVSLDGKLVWISDEGQRMLCIKDLAAVVGKSWIGFWAPEDEERVRTAVESAAKGEPARFLAMYRICDGVHWFDVMLTPVRGADGKPEKLLAISRDVTTAVETNKRLVEQARLLDLSGDAIIARKTDGEILFWNEGAERLYGWKREEALGKRTHDLLKTEFPVPLATVEEELAAKGQWVGELRHTCKDGTQVTVLSRKVLERDERGQPSFVLESNTDTTERKLWEGTLREGEDRLRLVSDSVPALISYIGPDFRYQSANRTYHEWFGLSREQVIGRPMSEVLGDAAWKQLEPFIRRAMAGEVVDFELSSSYARGGLRWIQGTYTPHRDRNGKVLGVVVLVQDITRRRLIEETLRESEARYRAFVEASASVVWRMNARGEVDAPIPSWNAFTGQTDEQARGFGWMNAIHRDDRARVVETWGRAIAGKSTYETEYRLLRAGRDWRRVLARGVPVFGADGEVREFVGTCIDVTESRRTEEAARESELLLRTVTNEAHVGLVVLDKERRYRYANSTYAEILGVPLEQLIGKPMPEVMADLYKDIKPHLDRAFAGERVSYEIRGLPRKDGDRRYFDIIYEPHFAPGREPYIVVVIIEVTERKLAQQTLEKTVRERTASLQETIQELESFSYSIAHDMRAPLRAMQGFAVAVNEDYGAQMPEGAKTYLERIRTSSLRLDDLIRDVLNYSKIVRGEMPLASLDVQPLLKEIVESYPNLSSPHAHIQIEGPMPRVKANPAAMTQVASNLLGNAVKFGKPNKDVHVKVWAENGATRPGFVRFWFEDDGIGIDKAGQHRIFQMFQRLNRAHSYEGTGIGLTIVKKAAERMGGRVGVESEAGAGSRFWVELRSA